MRWTRPIITVAYGLSIGISLRAQDAAIPLMPGLVDQRTVVYPHRQLYCVDLEAGGWCLLRVDQLGVDVTVTTYTHDHKWIAEFDSPNGTKGPEWVSLTASTRGRYFVEVHAITQLDREAEFAVHVIGIGTEPSDPVEGMDVFLNRYATDDSPGVAVRIMRGGEVLYNKGFGMADLEHGAPISPSTVFHVASVSKQFTAFAALLLEKEGRLSLDDDVRKYIPELPVYPWPITLRNLAQHTSGLRDIDDLLRLSGIGMNDEVVQAEALRILLQQKGLNFEPGTVFEYSNSGYMMLSEVVARVSDKPFAEVLSERIFQPLGMTNTRVVDVPGTVVANKAYSYGSEGEQYVKLTLNHALVGSTGVNTTVEDLCRWAMNFRTPVVGDRALMDRMERSGSLSTGEPFTYALGLDHKDYRGQQMIYHGGGEAGYRAYLVLIPAHDVVIAIASNAKEFIHVEAAEKAIDLFLADEVHASEAEQAKTKKPAPPSNYQALIGQYELFPGIILPLVRVDGGLALQLWGTSTYSRLKETGENSFQWKNKYDEFIFHPVADGAVHNLDYHLYDFTWRAPKVELKSVDLNALRPQDYTGRYFSEELGVVIWVDLADSVLSVSGHRNDPIPMQPFQPDEFRTDQSHIGHMAFVRDEKSAITGCVVSGNRAKGILFERIH